MNRSHRIAALVSVAVLGLAACGDDDGGEVLETPAEVATTIAVTETPEPAEVEEPPVVEPETTVPAPTEPPATTVPEPELPPESTTTVAPAVGGGAVGADDEADPADDAEPADGSGGDGEAGDGEPDDSAAADGALCLEGAWVITTEQLNGYYNALAANSGAGLTLGADGVVNVSFFDGDYQYSADFGITLDVGGTGGTGVATGTVNGTYTVADNVIEATTGESNLNVTITVAGVTMDGSELGNDLITSAPINNAPFTCGAAGEGPTLLFQSGPTADVRHPVVLTAL